MRYLYIGYQPSVPIWYIVIEFLLLSAIPFAYVLFVNDNFHENRPGSKQELLILLLAQIGDQKLQGVQCSATQVQCQLKFLSRTIILSRLIYIFKWNIVPGKDFKALSKLIISPHPYTKLLKHIYKIIVFSPTNLIFDIVIYELFLSSSVSHAYSITYISGPRKT